jgi:hypothetical protein
MLSQLLTYSDQGDNQQHETLHNSFINSYADHADQRMRGASRANYERGGCTIDGCGGGIYRRRSNPSRYSNCHTFTAH